MAYNFYQVNRDQLLLPQNLLDWVDEGDFSLFVIDLMSKIDCSSLYKNYRSDGKGQKAYNPHMMMSLLIYAYCLGTRSSRRIEYLCGHDISYRVICANNKPDHTSIARFRKNNLAFFETVFIEVLRLCQEAGMVKLGTVALDGTKMGANAALEANRTLKTLEREVKKIVAEAEKIDAEEDRKYGKNRRGDELPEEMQRRADRLAKLEECRQRLEERAAAERAAQEEKIQKRRREEDKRGKKLKGRKPNAPEDAVKKDAKVNSTDPDSAIMKARQGYVQGYNAQAAATAEQIIIAAEVVSDQNDQGQLIRQIKNVRETTKRAGVTEDIGKMLVDAGYPNAKNVEGASALCEELIAATGKEWKMRKEKGPPRGRIPQRCGVMDLMTRKVRTQRGRKLYAKRKKIIEPVFGQTKECRGIRKFLLRGREAVNAEWNLICATHNIVKMFRRMAPSMA